MSDDLRALVAAEHGLDARAARLLNGETVEELESSAAALAKLVSERNEQEPPARAPDLFTGAAAAKAAKQHALVNALTGRAPQPRDERGRFATGFDGGARESVPPPLESHDRWLARVIRERRADAGARF